MQEIPVTFALKCAYREFIHRIVVMHVEQLIDAWQKSAYNYV